MNISVILLVITVSAVAHSATVRYDVKGMDSKEGQEQIDFQATKPSIVESSSRATQEDMQVVQMKLQSNIISDSRNLNNKFSPQSEMPSQSFGSPDHFTRGSPAPQDFKRDEGLYHSQQPNIPVTTLSAIQLPQKDQYSDYSFQPDVYADQPQTPNQQQFYNMEHQLAGQQQFYSDKERASNEQQFYNDRERASNEQQFYNAGERASNEQQVLDAQQQMPNREQFYAGKQQGQPQFHDNMQAMGLEGQSFSNDRHFQSIANQQSQIRSGKHSTQIQTQGIMQLSAFDNREQPIVLPQRSSMHSTSVVVSGLKNLPLLPAMVYNSGSVPAAHAVAYGRGSWPQGGASVRQHMQTPYVRYVYSHIL